MIVNSRQRRDGWIGALRQAPVPIHGAHDFQVIVETGADRHDADAGQE